MTEEHLDLPEYEDPKGPLSRIVAASSTCTTIEWYDFYVFGTISLVVAGKFFNTGSSRGDLLAWLLAFAAGFVVRPFGAALFGRVSDSIGRRRTSFITTTIVGLGAFLFGVLPTEATIGALAGVVVVLLRIAQGLAIGGGCSGSATYVAEHAPDRKRGLYTSWIQFAATLGLVLSLGVILVSRAALGPAAFSAWGWRVPFLASFVLLGASMLVRLSLNESPTAARPSARDASVPRPVAETLSNPGSLKWIVLSVFGATMGEGVVLCTGQLFALLYLQQVLRVGLVDAGFIVGSALLAGIPFFVFMGWLSDRIGRKPIMLAGLLLAVLTYYPLFGLMCAYAPATVRQGVGRQLFFIPYQGYNPFVLGLCVFVMAVYVAMVFGPIAAFLAELFPTKVRYTSTSLAYHFGDGVFGGLVPVLGLSMIALTHNNYAGLWYPMLIAASCLIVGAIFLRETVHVDIHRDESYYELVDST